MGEIIVKLSEGEFVVSAIGDQWGMLQYAVTNLGNVWSYDEYRGWTKAIV